MPTPTIVTPRLTATPLTAADAPALFAYRSLPEVTRYQNWEPSHLDDAIRFIDDLATVEFDVAGTWFQFGIRLRDTGSLVGDVGVHFLGDGRQVEIGVTVAPAAQGRGIGTEAVVGLLDCLFGVGQKHRAVASVDPRNEPSLRLLRRVGMRQEAHFRQSMPFKGEWADDVVFAVLASEWPARRPAR